jgi:hypothetical protein
VPVVVASVVVAGAVAVVVARLDVVTLGVLVDKVVVTNVVVVVGRNVAVVVGTKVDAVVVGGAVVVTLSHAPQHTACSNDTCELVVMVMTPRTL